jgi:iron(III) transport system ATP-binding protein
MIEIDTLHKFYADGKKRLHVLKGISLNIGEGALYTLLGPSGCGKTTTLRSVAGLERPDSGAIRIAGQTVFSSGQRINVPTNKRPIGMVFQSYAIWPHMTVFENVAYPLAVKRVATDDMRSRVNEVLRVVGLEGLADRPAPKLSGGQQQRVALARALIKNPKVLLLDEPLSNLDAKLREQMRFEIKRLQRQFNITTIYVTHDQAEALAISDQIAVMLNGDLLEVGSPEQLYVRPRHTFTATFLGLTNLIAGRVRETVSEAAVGQAETSCGNIGFIASCDLRQNDRVLLSIRPEHIQISRSEPGQGGGNIVRGTVKEVTFMGEAFHAVIAAGAESLRVHTHPFQPVQVGKDVVLSLTQTSCSGLAARTATPE